MLMQIKLAQKTLCLNLLYVNNLYGLAMSQKLPLDRFKLFKNIFQLNKDFIKNFNGEGNEG